MRIILALAAATLAAGGASAQTGERFGAWGTQYNMGTFAAGTGEADADAGGWLSIQCNAAKGEGYIYAQVAGQPPAGGSMLTIAVSSRAGTRRHAFKVDGDGSVTTDPRSAPYLALWNDLRRGDIATVHFANGRKWVASLAGAGRALTPGGCVD